MLFLIHKVKLLQLFYPHPMNQHVSPSYQSFLTVTQSYHGKVTHIDALHAEITQSSFALCT